MMLNGFLSLIVLFMFGMLVGAKLVVRERLRDLDDYETELRRLAAYRDKVERFLAELKRSAKEAGIVVKE